VVVIGGPDARNTLFTEETTLVSTHNRQQLVALVVVAGAPQSALQQYPRYRRQLEQVRAYRPMFVLPEFLADANQARLALALGMIFDFIYTQGTYFYYQAADALKPPMRLDNGLANAIQTLESQERLVREILDRVEGHVTQLGSQRTVEILADYYTVPPDGRSSLDDLTRELKQLVREYAQDLRQIDAFRGSASRNSYGGPAVRQADCVPVPGRLPGAGKGEAS